MTKKSILKSIRLIFINLAIILVLLILLDPLVGLLSTENQGELRQINFNENPPLSTLKLKPSGDKDDSKPILKRTDEHGFIIGPNDSLGENIDFIFLGASNVESENVEENKRFPYLSIKLLNEKLETHYKSRNAGVGGNLLSMSNLILTSKIAEIQPDYVILSSSLIDILYLSKNQSYWTGTKKYLVNPRPRTLFLKGVKDYFFPNIWLQARKFLPQNNNSGFASSDFSPYDIDRILKAYEKQLDVFIQTCKIYNIKPILTTDYHVPELMEGNYVKKKVFNSQEVKFYTQKLIPRLNELIKQKAETYKIPFIPLPTLIEKNRNFVNNEDGIHLTNAGSERLSIVISNFLENKIIDEEYKGN